MVPTIAASGTSFKGAALYYLHDKDAATKERVAWTATDNLLTDNAEKAWKIMAWTAMHQGTLKVSAGVRATGRKLEKPVFALSLSWHPEEKPDKAHMLATAKAAGAVLGLAEHQAIYVSHNDEPQAHVHVLVNRVHPQTGKAATLSHSKEKVQAWALEYEKKHGKVYCPARANNARHRAERKPERDRNPVIQAAWARSDSGKGFQAALKAQGYTLAQGNRRIVVVDRYGKVQNPVRELPGVRAADFKDRLKDIDLAALPTAAAVQKTIKARDREQYHAVQKFEKWSAGYLNKNQDRQIEERAAMNARYAKTLADRKEALAEQYRLGKLTQSITELRQRTEQPSLLRRVTGGVAKDRAELNAQQQQLADVERRMGEQLGAIRTEHHLATADLADRHGRENELARAYIAERKSVLHAVEPRPAQERAGRVGGRGRDDEGGRERVYRHAQPSLRMI